MPLCHCLLPLLPLLVGTEALRLERLPSWARTDIKDVLVMRALQTQLYYLRDLRDEPTARWLAGFMDHNHLDSYGRYAALDQQTKDLLGRKRGLSLPGYDYVTALSREPEVRVLVELAPDPFTAARASKNPYLKPAVQTYEEVIEPCRLAASLMVTAVCLADEFRDDLHDLSQSDAESAALARHLPLLHSTWSSHWNVVIAGGEEGDGKTPLRRLNQRILERLCTLKAAGLLLNELVERGAAAEQTGEGTYSALTAGGLSPSAARAAAFWWRGFLETWVPRLLLGRDDENRERLGRVAPGAFRRRRLSDDPLADGIDADEFTELVFQEVRACIFVCEKKQAGGQVGKQYHVCRVYYVLLC